MSQPLILEFPKQPKDYKEASRMIRTNPIFREFVISKSKDRRRLSLDFQTEEKFKTLSPILLQTLEKIGYVVDIVK